MQRLVLLSCLTSSSCAAYVWDSRVFSCDDVDSVDLRGGRVIIEQEVDDEGDPVECYVAVYGLRGLDVDGDTLSGTDFTVFTTEDFLDLDLKNSRLVIDQPERQITGPFDSDYVWNPSRQVLTADVPDDDELAIVGSIRELYLEGEGDAVVLQAEGLTVVEGTVGDLAVEALTWLERVDVDAQGDVALVVPLSATYRLDADVTGVTDIEPRLRLRLDDADTYLGITADNLTLAGWEDGTVTTVPGPTRNVEVTCEEIYYGYHAALLSVRTSLPATDARIDIVDSYRGPEIARYESHALYPQGPNITAPYVAWLIADSYYGDGVATRFACLEEEEEELAEVPGGQTMTYLVRIYDGAALVDCYAVGHDAPGMIDGAYANGINGYKPDQITPEVCVALPPPSVDGTMP